MLSFMATPPDKLAREIASVLDDMDALPLHQKFAEKYSESFLRKKLMRVLSIPERKIKRSRAALYNFLIQQHEHSESRTKSKRKGRTKRHRTNEPRYEYEDDNDWN